PSALGRAPRGAAAAGPAVAGGKVYVADRLLAGGAANPMNAFARARVAGVERVLCLDAATGKEVWKHEYPCEYAISYPGGPRCTPTVDGDRVYSLGAMGDLVCLDAKTGKPLWARNFIKEYGAPTPIWGFAGHPLVDGDKLICIAGGTDALAVACDKKTGKELWKALDAREPGYAPPVIVTLGGKRQLIVWSPAAVNGLDPEAGKAYWSQPYRGPD